MPARLLDGRGHILRGDGVVGDAVESMIEGHPDHAGCRSQRPVTEKDWPVPGRGLHLGRQRTAVNEHHDWPGHADGSPGCVDVDVALAVPLRGFHCDNERVHIRRDVHGPIPSRRARVRHRAAAPSPRVLGLEGDPQVRDQVEVSGCPAEPSQKQSHKLKKSSDVLRRVLTHLPSRVALPR
jgi:hypothetical protein